MAHNLVSLLGGGSTDALALRELRTLTQDGVDVRLIADILSRAHGVMRRLGLDPSDTTAQEVYQALKNAVATDQFLALLEDTDYVLLEVQGEVISFNPVDIIDNYHFELPIEQRRTQAGRKGLGWEITRRYKDHPRASRQRVESAAQRAKWPTTQPQFCSISFGKPTILSVGDIASEALITLAKDDAEVIGGQRKRKLAIDLGAKIDAQTAEVQDAVGGAANASVTFAKFDIQPVLMSWVGGDAVGRTTVEHLRSYGVDMSGVRTEKSKRSNYHYVLRSGAERTIIARYEDFEYRWRSPLCRPDWLYLSMISQQSWELHQSLLQYLDEHKSMKLAFQPGPSHLAWGSEKLGPLLARTEVMILNMDEAMALVGDTTRDMQVLIASIHDMGVAKVVITDGPRGAYASNGEECYEVPSYPDVSRPLDRSGAGDAFASTLVAAMAHGMSFEDALLLAPINSMNVVQYLGPQAGLLGRGELERMQKSAPEGYTLKQL